MTKDKYKSLIYSSMSAYVCHKLIIDNKKNTSDLQITEINPAFELITGIKENKIIGLSSIKLFKKLFKDVIDLKVLFDEVKLSGKEKSIDIYSKPLRAHFQLNISMPEDNCFVTFITDISKYKDEFNQLKAEEEKFRLLLDSTLEVIIMINTRGKIVYVNNQIEKNYGYSPSEIIGESLKKFVPKIEIPRYIKILKKLFIEKKISSFETSVYHRDGRIINVEMSGKMVKKRKKKFALAVVRDLSKYDEVEKKLKYNEEQLRLIAENTKDIITLQSFDMKAKYLYVSPSIKEIGGWNPEELIGKSFTKLIHQEDIKKLLPVLKKYVGIKLKSLLKKQDYQENVIVEYRAKHKEGGWRYMQSSGSILGDQILFISRDITERVEFEKQLKDSEENYRSIFDHVKDGIVHIDSNFRILNVNPAFSTITLISKDQVIGRSVASLGKKFLSAQQIPKILSTLKNILLNKTGKPLIVKINKKTVELTGSKNITKNRIILLLKDITNRKHVEEKIKNYISLQETLLKEINHRVKNNLSAILGMISIEQYKVENNPTKTSQSLVNLEARIKSLSTVHNLLSKNKWQPMKLSYLSKQILSESLKNLTEYKKFKLFVTESDEIVNSSHAHYITLVLNELVINTIKYADYERSKIKLTVNIEKKNNSIILSYSDSGPGYPNDIIHGKINGEGKGIKLIQGIVAGSLGGTVRFINEKGAKAIIQFKIKKE